MTDFLKKIVIIALVITFILLGFLFLSPQQSILPDITQKTANIIVNSPQKYTSEYPLHLNGKARVFENTLSYRLSDNKNNIITEGFITTKASDVEQYGDFEKNIYYPETNAKEGVLKVFQISAKDGSEIDTVDIPVYFPVFDGPNLKIYFGNKIKDSKALKCDQTYPVIRRIPQKISTVDAALGFLLTGPTQEEQQKGYFSSLPDYVNVKLIALDNKTGKLLVDFDESLMRGVAGSCRVMAIKSQLLNTLKQFDNVKDVLITINSKSEGVFEP